jgi:membrane protein
VQNDVPAQVVWGRGAREGSECWVLLLEPHLIRLADVYRLFVFGSVAETMPALGGGAEPASVSTSAAPLALDTAALARQVDAAVGRGLDATLAEHFEHVEPLPA